MREIGVTFSVSYPEGMPKRLSKLTARLRVSLWRRRVLRKYGHLITRGLDWPELSSTPYFSWKPDHDGQMALVLAAAYAECPHLAAPTELPRDYELDPAYGSISKDYFQSMVAILECHMFLPSDEDFVIAGPDAAGTKRFVTSTANLRRALDFVNQAHWQANAAQIDAWDKRGPPTRKILVVEAGKVVSDQDVVFPANPFEHLAQFAFAAYSLALKFSQAHRVPIVTDA
jgi:hypothetical protein